MAQDNTDEGNIFLFLYYIRPFGLLALVFYVWNKFGWILFGLALVPSKLIYFFEMFEFTIYMFSFFYFVCLHLEMKQN